MKSSSTAGLVVSLLAVQACAAWIEGGLSGLCRGSRALTGKIELAEERHR
jgi:hypothetical protein